jgi:hypothetical protein
VVLICVSGENFVFAKSRVYRGQSPAGIGVVCAKAAGSSAARAKQSFME